MQIGMVRRDSLFAYLLIPKIGFILVFLLKSSINRVGMGIRPHLLF